MLRLPRTLPALVIAAAISYALPAQLKADDAPTPAPATPAPAPATPAPGDAGAPAAPATPAPADTGAPAAPATPAPADTGAPATPAPTDTGAAPATAPSGAEPQSNIDALKGPAEDFWHYARIGKFDLAADAGKQLLAASTNAPTDMLAALESVAGSRHEDLDAHLITWQTSNDPGMKDVCTQILQQLRAGRLAKRADTKFIQANIAQLGEGDRAYFLAVQQLKQSGELAVPEMIDVLLDNAKQQLHFPVRQALVELGRPALNPLVAATEMKDVPTLLTVIDVLGDIGYDAAVPYLARLANGSDVDPTVRAEATRTLIRLGVSNPNGLKPADLFYDFGEKLYYNNASIAADSRYPVSYVWFWDTSRQRLMSKSVAPEIFTDVMSMRACEYALKLDASKSEAVSLWLAADNKREADLPDGATDPTHDGQPSAHFYNVAAGPQYVDPALARALKDRNSAVALKLVKSLAVIVGPSNVEAASQDEPIVDALSYPDRLVRFEAAMALAADLPTKSFGGDARVVPILAEALAQTGKPGAIVVAGDQNALNTEVKALQDAGYDAVGALTAADALESGNGLAGVDVIVVDTAKESDSDAVDLLISRSPRFERTPRLYITGPTSPVAARAASNPLVNITQATDKDGLGAAVTAARTRAGALGLDEKSATAYALRAADLLGRLAINNSKVLDVTQAQSTLIAALDDSRVEIAKAAGNVLAMMDTKDAQVALVTKASDDKTADELKIAVFKDAAANAKTFGNRLDGGEVDAVKKVIEGASNADVRSAAGEAFGALNLSTEQVKTLILNQSKT